MAGNSTHHAVVGGVFLFILLSGLWASQLGARSEGTVSLGASSQGLFSGVLGRSAIYKDVETLAQRAVHTHARALSRSVVAYQTRNVRSLPPACFRACWFSTRGESRVLFNDFSRAMRTAFVESWMRHGRLQRPQGQPQHNARRSRNLFSACFFCMASDAAILARQCRVPATSPVSARWPTT